MKATKGTILKEGTVKQKIDLYFTHLAQENIGDDIEYTGEYTALSEPLLKGLEPIKKSNQKRLLDEELKKLDEKIADEAKEGITASEEILIYKSITDSKDIKYFNNQRIFNKSFLMFKPTINTYIKNFDYLTAHLSKYTVEKLLHKKYEETINNMLGVVEDKNIREQLVDQAIRDLKMFDAKKMFIKTQSNTPLASIRIPDGSLDTQMITLIKKINTDLQDAKEFITGIKTFVNKNVPLTPYKEFIKGAEDRIKTNIELCRKIVESYIGKDLAEGLDNLKILRWEEVDVEITKEDLENIKRAGL